MKINDFLTIFGALLEERKITPSPNEGCNIPFDLNWCIVSRKYNYLDNWKPFKIGLLINSS